MNVKLSHLIQTGETSMSSLRFRPAFAATAAAALLAACGGGGSSSSDSPSTPDQGTLRVRLTDAPACGYDNAWVTVTGVRVHVSDAADPDGEGGWVDIPLAAGPQRVDLLTLTNGTLLPLGETELPAGTYRQMRLMLAPNTAAEPLANAVNPSGNGDADITALTTPSGVQSGLKMKVNITVPAGQVADVAIDFDACKSFVKAGRSGKILLKPKLSIIPILSQAGQKIVGYVDPSLLVPGTVVSVQVDGEPVRATPPLENAPRESANFVLYPVPVGTYDLVIASPGRATVVMTGVPATADATTFVGSPNARFNPPVSASYAAAGTVTVGGAAADTGGLVRALQALTGGPTVEVGAANANAVDGTWSMLLPTAAPLTATYAAGLTALVLTPDAAAAGFYTLEATVPAATTAATLDLDTANPPPAPIAFVFP
jgi:Domain of unknown function (DUF4382)